MSNVDTNPEEQLAKGRGKESLLRVTLRNQVNQIAIADRRARIVLNLTTLLISLSLIALLTTDLTIEREQLQAKNLTNPLVVLMIWSLTSALMSVMSLNPIFAKESSGYSDHRGFSLLFSRNLSKYTLEEYRNKMTEMLSSNWRFHLKPYSRPSPRCPLVVVMLISSS